MSWIEPVTNRTSAVQYTYVDSDRVGNDIQFLADSLNSYGYAVTVSPKTDWAIGNTPRAAQMARYLADLATLKAAFYGTTVLPASMRFIGYDDANNIEKQLIEIETYINRMILGFRKCGTIKSGEGVILP